VTFVRYYPRWAAILAATALSGCAPLGPLPVVAPPELVAGVMSTPSAETVQASGSIQIMSPEGFYNAGLVMSYRAPDSLRALVQVGFGTTVAELALTGPTGVAYLPQTREAYLLDAESALMIGTSVVYPALLLRLMEPVSADDLTGDTLRVMSSGGSYYLRDEAPDGVRTWKISGRGRDLEGEDFTATGSTIEWHRSFTTQRARRVPSLLTVTFGESTMTVHLNRINIAPHWNTTPFVVRLPDGLVPIDLSTRSRKADEHN